jgi:1,4-dihydroxy-2-naphthoate polyprenyltransferase
MKVDGCLFNHPPLRISNRRSAFYSPVNRDRSKHQAAGLIIFGILVVINLRDLETDGLAGRHTLAVMLGERFAKSEYLGCMVVAFLSMPFFCGMKILPCRSLLTWLMLPLAWKETRVVFTQKGKGLNAALGGIGQLVLAFSLLFLVGLLLSTLG